MGRAVFNCFDDPILLSPSFRNSIASLKNRLKFFFVFQTVVILVIFSIFYMQFLLIDSYLGLWSLTINIRWVSVVEFHDRALCRGNVFGQELTVIEWNYQILGHHQVTVHQKLGVILVIKCTEVRFASLFSGGFITAIVVNPPERKLPKRSYVHCRAIWRNNMKGKISQTVLTKVGNNYLP